MKRFLIAAALSAVAFTTPAFASNVDVSVNIGQPGFYGRLDVVDYPRPRVIHRRPIVIEQVYEQERPPIYLRVPPRHSRHWNRYCGEYNACGERVLFVQDNWYQREYVSHYRERHHARRDDRHRRGHGNDRY
jgi:hypothetical protein